MSNFLPETNNPYEFQSHLLSGVGPYNDPLSIYSKGHKTYSKNLITGLPDISGIVENIDIINNGSNTNLQQDQVKLFKQVITEDITIPIDRSGLSVNLKFTSFNVETQGNVFKNL